MLVPAVVGSSPISTFPPSSSIPFTFTFPLLLLTFPFPLSLQFHLLPRFSPSLALVLISSG